LLGIFVDPCLWKGFQAIRSLKRGARVTPPLSYAEKGPTRAKEKRDFAEMLAATPVLNFDFRLPPSLTFDADLHMDGPAEAVGRRRFSSKVSLDMCTALSALPLDAGRNNMALASSSVQARPIFTRHFSGVPCEALPEGLTDGVDIERGDRRLRWDTGVKGHTEENELGQLDPLDPDIPDEGEERQRRRKADLVTWEEMARAFRETEAQL